MNTQSGRSMVEMLGVLAIVGVLSVGAIAGYSKAMMKYKLNKQAESFNMLLNNALQLNDDLIKTVKHSSNVEADFFDKAHLIPDGMNYNASDNRIHDIFGNRIQIYYINNTEAKVYEYVMRIEMERSGTKINERSREICRNMALVAKENATNLYYFRMRSYDGDNYDDSHSLYGSKSPYNNTSLAKSTIKQIDDMCSSCNSETSCEAIIMLHLTSYQ